MLLSFFMLCYSIYAAMNFFKTIILLSLPVIIIALGLNEVHYQSSFVFRQLAPRSSLGNTKAALKSYALFLKTSNLLTRRGTATTAICVGVVGINKGKCDQIVEQPRRQCERCKARAREKKREHLMEKRIRRKEQDPEGEKERNR